VSRDPYRYFRIEAQELLEGLSRGFLALDRGADPERVRGLLRQAHTFKGAARVVKEVAIGELAHELEDLLSPHRETSGPVPRELVDRALRLIDDIRERVGALGAPAEGEAPAAPRPQAEEALRSLRVGALEMDSLLAGLHEAASAAALLNRDLSLLNEALSVATGLAEDARSLSGPSRVAARAEALSGLLDRARRSLLEQGERASREIARLQELGSDLRLVPAEALLIDLERAARDAARALGKRVSFRASGAGTRIDAQVLSGVRAAMVHLVRNAVAHGIEAPSARAAAGKPPEGIVEVLVERRGHLVALTCRDDGPGLDVESVRRVALESGRIRESEFPGLEAGNLVQMLLKGGLSTTPSVTEVSGRGVGLDAVRAAVEELNGEVAIETKPGEGTSVRLLVPVSLSELPVLMVELDGSLALLPLDCIRRAVRLEKGSLLRAPEGERLVVDGETVPYLLLSRALSSRALASGRSDGGSAVVLEAEGARAALGIDRVRGVRSVLLRSLPEGAPVEPVVSAAAFDEEGVPRPVLDPAALVERARQALPPSAAVPAPVLPPLLVIDDSLTTRMLEQSILESAGYEVELAVSAEEALARAKTRRFGAFIVDVEMPGMNGFEFIAEARADPALRDVPCILVTSRAKPEDKRRGKDLGARAYIVKSEFDQQELLSSIRSLLG
jgi:two-component system chemotaxis sensor kinase CheA